MLFKLTICVLFLFQWVSAKNFIVINKFEIESNEVKQNEVAGKFDDPPPDYKDYAKMARWLVHNNGES